MELKLRRLSHNPNFKPLPIFTSYTRLSLAPISQKDQPT
jgi:hypothetical protein